MRMKQVNNANLVAKNSVATATVQFNQNLLSSYKLFWRSMPSVNIVFCIWFSVQFKIKSMDILIISITPHYVNKCLGFQLSKRVN